MWEKKNKEGIKSKYTQRINNAEEEKEYRRIRGTGSVSVGTGGQGSSQGVSHQLLGRVNT